MGWNHQLAWDVFFQTFVNNGISITFPLSLHWFSRMISEPSTASFFFISQKAHLSNGKNEEAVPLDSRDRSNGKNAGWLDYIGDCTDTTQVYRDYNEPL